MIRRSLPVLVTLAASLEFAALALVMTMNRIEWLPVSVKLEIT